MFQEYCRFINHKLSPYPIMNAVDPGFRDWCKYHLIKAYIRRAMWRLRWPNHCTACRGYGGFETTGSRYEPPTFDPCEALPFNTCHRCNQPGLTEDGDGPCSKCGWDYNDGDPEVGYW